MGRLLREQMSQIEKSIDFGVSHISSHQLCDSGKVINLLQPQSPHLVLTFHEGEWKHERRWITGASAQPGCQHGELSLGLEPSDLVLHDLNFKCPSWAHVAFMRRSLTGGSGLLGVGL